MEYIVFERRSINESMNEWMMHTNTFSMRIGDDLVELLLLLLKFQV